MKIDRVYYNGVIRTMVSEGDTCLLYTSRCIRRGGREPRARSAGPRGRAMKRSYLEHIKIVSFGAFSNKAVGPFAPHLNVVYGPNEAGKTTLASFVGGVLFGWEEARGSRNTYKRCV